MEDGDITLGPRAACPVSCVTESRYYLCLLSRAAARRGEGKDTGANFKPKEYKVGLGHKSPRSLSVCGASKLSCTCLPHDAAPHTVRILVSSGLKDQFWVQALNRRRHGKGEGSKDQVPISDLRTDYY